MVVVEVEGKKMRYVIVSSALVFTGLALAACEGIPAIYCDFNREPRSFGERLSCAETRDNRGVIGAPNLKREPVVEEPDDQDDDDYEHEGPKGPKGPKGDGPKGPKGDHDGKGKPSKSPGDDDGPKGPKGPKDDGPRGPKGGDGPKGDDD